MALEISPPSVAPIVLGETLMGRADYLRIGGIVARGLGAVETMEWLPADTKDTRTGLLQTQSHSEIARLAVAATQYIEKRTGNSVFELDNTGMVLQFGDVSMGQRVPTAIYTATIQPRHAGLSLSRQRFSVDYTGHVSRQPAPEYLPTARMQTFQLLGQLGKYHLEQQTVAQLHDLRAGQIEREQAAIKERIAASAENPSRRLRFWPNRR